ncbi:MAG: DUF1778 domain-containing protein [Prochlorothrix sp.]
MTRIQTPLRLSPEEKQLFTEAANASGLSFNEWILSAAHAALDSPPSLAPDTAPDITAISSLISEAISPLVSRIEKLESHATPPPKATALAPKKPTTPAPPRPTAPQDLLPAPVALDILNSRLAQSEKPPIAASTLRKPAWQERVTKYGLEPIGEGQSRRYRDLGWEPPAP